MSVVVLKHFRHETVHTLRSSCRRVVDSAYMRKILSKNFFEMDTLKVAENLLGKYLVRKIGDKEIALKINEIEVKKSFQNNLGYLNKPCSL